MPTHLTAAAAVRTMLRRFGIPTTGRAAALMAVRGSIAGISHIAAIGGPLLRQLADAMFGGDAGGGGAGLGISEFRPRSSTAISLVRYRLRDGRMHVRFNKTRIYPDYLFPNVPGSVFRDWKVAGSAGSYYHANVKNQYGM